MNRSSSSLDRYSRQVLFEKFGERAQRRLLESRAVLFGCGALGSVLADTLVRAGVGTLRILDRDYIERDNLQRQVLYDEEDIRAGLPKAEAAARELRRINSDVNVECEVVDVNPSNIERLAQGAMVLLDGTDNFETRYLINDLAVKTRRPWIYGAVIGATGLCMPVLPGETPCLRCVFESAPPPEMNPTCDTAGVLGPAVKMVASFQALEAMKILGGLTSQVTRRLLNIDTWTGRIARLDMQPALEQGTCPCCTQGRFDYLDGKLSSMTVTLCGRNAVQITPPAPVTIDFEALAGKLTAAGGTSLRHNAYMLSVDMEGLSVTVFNDGRAILKGTRDEDHARSIFARYVGS